jgi:hypothetical protein
MSAFVLLWIGIIIVTCTALAGDDALRIKPRRRWRGKL